MTATSVVCEFCHFSDKRYVMVDKQGNPKRKCLHVEINDMVDALMSGCPRFISIAW
jgi:hypothetical protein